MHYITRAETRGVELNLGFEKTNECVLLCRKKIDLKWGNTTGHKGRVAEECRSLL